MSSVINSRDFLHTQPDVVSPSPSQKRSLPIILDKRLNTQRGSPVKGHQVHEILSEEEIGQFCVGAEK